MDFVVDTNSEDGLDDIVDEGEVEEDSSDF